MTRSITVPEELYDKAVELAAKEHISVEEFVSAALADQLATRRYLDDRAKRASKERFRQALAQLPDVSPEEYDRL